MSSFEKKIKELLFKVRELEANEALKAERKLPSDCYFLEEDTVVSYRRKDGDARYPYAYDGLTLWAYASGNVKMEESTFNILLPVAEGKEPHLCFFVGEKQEEGYFPISLLGPARQGTEKNVKRYTIFTPQAVYYFTETKNVLGAVRMLVDDKKLLRLSVYLENISEEKVQTYLSSYVDYFLFQGPCENFETKWYKRCAVNEYGYLFSTTEHLNRDTCFEHYAPIARSSYAGGIDKTTSRPVYTGSLHNQLNCAQSLFEGKFERQKYYTEFTETAIAGDIIPLCLEKGENFVVSYTTAFSDDKDYAEKICVENRETATIDEYIERKVQEERSRGKNERMPKITFGGAEAFGVNDVSLEYFTANVLRQVEFVSKAKNYAGHLIGIRDIFQQVEASLMWIPAYSRGKIIEALGYVGEDGRAPRQYSYPRGEGVLPQMDLREFIDQGVWIISTVFSYLAFTGDYSILDEVCGYYKLDGNKVDFSSEKDTVLEHLIRITEFLLSNLAKDTGCLRALYGDWNDALDGLGIPDDKTKKYGDGVSVMATLQLYKNLEEMCKIFRATGKFTEKIQRYEEFRTSIQSGLIKHAIVENEKGERKIVHGWGDKIGYKIASFSDNDGENRDGLTSNAFWVLCNALSWDKTLKADILNAFERLDSKYGLKTFEPYFAPSNKAVGRITKLPKGTAENGATYIHATLFGILALFEMGESQKAWAQIYKILPITHEVISTTPFIMPNSYIYNEERGFDGESMNDWFTGSGCVLIKLLVWEAFGLLPDLNGLTVRPANYFPMQEASISMQIKGCTVTLLYKNEGVGKRTFKVNGQKKSSVYDTDAQTEKLYFTNAELQQGELIIEVID